MWLKSVILFCLVAFAFGGPGWNQGGHGGPGGPGGSWPEPNNPWAPTPPSIAGTTTSPNCGPLGGCQCDCKCPKNGGGGGGGGGGGWGPCPTCPPGETPVTNGTIPNPTLSRDCLSQITAASIAYNNIGSILGAILHTVLSKLVMPILTILLFGNNTVIGAVIPLATTLCYVLGLVLLLLQKLGLLGLLGQNGLLGNLLETLTGALGAK